ncbi:MAG: single-stranded DNA-binding protein [Clostridia bacterium]|nr:single-stranded DNA-binding protein [Clostridia bacterium]
MAFNKVILMGRLTADPELKQTQSGVSVTSFNIAVDRKVKDSPCDFFTINAWRQTAEFICKYFKKGQAILVCGELQTRSWTDNNGQKRTVTEVVTSEATFCEGKKESDGNSAPTYSNGSQGNFGASPYIPQAYTQPSFDAKDEDLPF